MTIFYEFEGKLYANITNKCPCSCIFCIRKNGDSVADNDSLWLEHEPSYEEIIKAFDDFDKTGLHELVFCGYGECGRSARGRKVCQADYGYEDPYKYKRTG